MKSALATLLVFALPMLLLAGCLNSGYENRFKGFSTYLPSGWSVYEDALSVGFSPPWDPGVQVTVIATSSAENATLENLSHAGRVRTVSSLTGVNVLNQSDSRLTISGLPALETSMDLESDIGGQTARSHVRMAFFKNATAGRYYIVSFFYTEPPGGPSRLAEYEKDYERMLAEFKVLW